MNTLLSRNTVVTKMEKKSVSKLYVGLVVGLYVAMGFYGYLKFGENIKGSITLNLPPGDMWVSGAYQEMFTTTYNDSFISSAAQICLLLFSLSIFFS